MKTHDLLRVVSSVCFVLSILVITFGLESVQAATYEGQWTKIILDRVNPSSVDLQGTVKVTGPDLTPKSYNLPATISATRLAKLAKGFLRGGVYGIAIDAAMQNGGWVWDELMKNWKKTINHTSDIFHDCSTPVGSVYKVTGAMGFPHGSFALKSSIDCLQYQPSGAITCGLSKECGLDRHQFVLLSSPVQETQATDQQIFDEGVKPSLPSAIPNIITGLPDVLFTPSAELKKPGMPSIHWPEIVLDLVNFVNNLNITQNIFDIVNQAFTDINSLTQTQIDMLINKGINIQTLIDAINNTVNNTNLTTEQKDQLQLWETLQNPATNPPLVIPPEPLALEIPTDCDLIPFVCAWLEWYRDWLTEDPPPVPEAVIPIEELDDFNPADGPPGSCPMPYQFSVFSRQYEVSYQPFCDLALLLNPLIIAMAWLISGYIVTRSR